MSVLQQLESAEDLTYVEAQIAQYILSHSEEAAHQTINELGKQTNTSNAAIIRLCRKLGFGGYKSFKVELLKDLERRRNKHLHVDIDFPIGTQEKTQDILRIIADLTIESVNSSYEVLNAQAMEVTALFLSQARMIYFYAAGDSMMSTLGFSNRILKLMKYSTMMTQYGEIEAHVRTMNAQDVFVLISYSGKTTLSESYLNRIRKSKAKMILITAGDSNDQFDTTLRFPLRESKSNKLATYYSQISITYIFNCLYALMYANITNQAAEFSFFDEH